MDTLAESLVDPYHFGADPQFKIFFPWTLANCSTPSDTGVGK
jgi:hypothetical protein